MKISIKAYLFNTVILAISLSVILSPNAGKAGDTPSITPEYLMSGKWGPENLIGIKIVFTGDSLFESEINFGQSGTDAAGTYSIKNGKLFLSIEKASPDKSIIGLTLKNGTPEYDPMSPKYRRYITFKGKELEKLYFRDNELRIWDYNSLVKEGEHLKINGTEAVAMGAKKGSTTAVLKMRETPSPKAKEVHYTYDDIDRTYTVKALPDKTPLVILARTTDKEKVGKWNNYWYYVEFERYFDYMRAWVYGEFVQIEK